MPSDSQTPYSTPGTDECLSESAIVQMKQPLLPPLKIWRLAVAMALVTGALVALWALVHHQQIYCLIIIGMCTHEISSLLDPHHRRFGSKPIHEVGRWIAGSGVAAVFLVVWLWWREIPIVSGLLRSPVSYGVAWLISCGLLLRDWWKRRNNPPYQPELEIDPTAFSRWKRLRRLGIRE